MIADKYGIANHPSLKQIANIKYLCEAVFQPLRDWINEPITILSGFRSRELNGHEDVGGSWNSDHLCLNDCAAGDITTKSYKTLELIDIMSEMKLPTKQVIDEFGIWVHVSAVKPRQEYLRALKTENFGTKYERIKKYAS